LDRLGLKVEAKDVAAYRHLVELVRREVTTDQTILALPANPEVYFLSRRQTTVRFYNSSLGIDGEAGFNQAMRVIRDHPPQLVFHRPQDKYNTEYGDRIMAYVRGHYAQIEEFSGFKIYRRRPN
jgi:hypothetical protein